MFTARFSHLVAPSAFFALSTLALVAAAPAANAQASLVFSGGSGTPFTLSLLTPVTYTITTGTQSSSPIFIFQGAGNTVNFFSSSLSGTLSYAVNGGAATTFNFINTDYNSNAVTTNDIIIGNYNNNRTFAVGDVIRLSSGTLMTNDAVVGAIPANGSYTTFVTEAFGARISSNGISTFAAPEPGSIPLLGMGLITGACMVGTVKRRKAKQIA